MSVVGRNASMVGAITLACASILFVIFARAQDQRKIDELTRTTHHALCSFKVELENRANQTRRILVEHPGEDPIHVYGLTVPRAEMQANLANQDQTLASLASLQCE